MEHNRHQWWLGLCLAGGVWAAQAQTPVPMVVPVPAAMHNVVHLQAAAQQEVVQDWLTALLVARVQGSDAAGVQQQLQRALERAVGQLKAQVPVGSDSVQFSTGGFSVQPRYGRDNQISGWQGRAEVLLQGRDTTRVAQLAAALPAMVVERLQFSLSPTARAQAESAVRAQAIARFRENATEVARRFGFDSYTLREVTLSEDMPTAPVFKARGVALAEAAPMADIGVPIEPGKTAVQVQVAGSVQLQ